MDGFTVTAYAEYKRYQADGTAFTLVKGKNCAEVDCSEDIDSLPGDKALAADMSKAVAAVMGNADRGAKTRPGSDPSEDFYGIIDAAQDIGCPHVLLIESGFHDNALDEAFLLVDANLKAIAEAQAAVICKHLGAVPDSDSAAVQAEVYALCDAMQAAGVSFERTKWAAVLAGQVSIDAASKRVLVTRAFAAAQAAVDKRLGKQDMDAAEMRRVLGALMAL